MKSITDAKDAGGFVRQLNMWGFQRYREGGERSCGFSHPFFRRGRPDLLEKMLRKGETKPTRVYAKVQYAALMDTTPDLSLLSTPGSELDGLSLASPLPAQVRPKARKPRAPKIGGNSRAKRTSTTSTKTPGSPLKRSHSVSLEHDDIDTTPDDQDISTSSKAPASSSTKIPKHSKKRARN
ncbi:hypothetical protein Q8F55_004284 [Vanrija albida]|uniref:HSF-type DNA-binding domain-containing protein n=1 Tax=Vanrija albida TaxID=181172 RepID=A0ABR3Q6I8_9TREE